MKLFFVCVAFVSYTLAGKLEYGQQAAAYSHHYSTHEAAIPIVRSVSDIQPDGSYAYEYETGNGIVAKEHGVGGKSSQGSFGYTAPDGQVVQLSYVADEHGFHPTGSHIPQPPPTPPHILRALEWIAAHPYQPEQQKYGNVQPHGAVHSQHSSAHFQAGSHAVGPVHHANAAHSYGYNKF